MLEAQKLPAELVSLVHHVELNKAGWWDKAVQQVIVATIWLSGESLSVGGVLEKLRGYFSVNLDAEKARNHTAALCHCGTLVPLEGERFKISEHSLKEFERGLKEAETMQEEVHHRFLEAMERCCPVADAEATWQAFNDQFLVPLIHDMGARTYELLSGTSMDLAATPRLQDFLQRYAPEIRAPLRTAVVTFLDPKDSNVRSYILHELNAYFFLEAGNLSAETVDALTTIAGGAARFIVFVDTNFLFSILGVHENPSNEAAQSLMDLVSHLSDKVAVQFYVLPITAEEARTVLEAGAQGLRDLRLTPNLADVAATSGLTGLAQKFAEETKRVGHALRAQDYFEPYIRDLIRIARARGVEFFNDKLDQYRLKTDVLIDVDDQLEFQKRFGHRAKGREQLEHDMVLWHFVRDRRPVSMESPLEAESWIVTVDLRFLGFDSYKRRFSPNKIPVCLHPATLIQMLQLWVPRTQQFEEAVLGNLRLPCLFQEFDPDAERLTIRILGALARFENVRDLPQEAVGSILMNNALRERLRTEGDVEKQVELVREALIEENQRVRVELKAAEARAEDLQRKAAETLAQLRQTRERQKDAIEESERQLGEERASRNRFEERLQKVEAALRSKEEQEQAKARIRGFAVKWAVTPLAVIVALGLGVSIALANLTALGPLWSALTGAGVFSASLILWVWLTDWRGSRDAIVSQWRPFSRFHGFKKWLFTVLGLIMLGLFVGVLANALWDRIGQIL